MKAHGPLPIVFASALALAGCFGDRAEVYPVSGSVTFEGEPMPMGGTIAFVPKGAGQGPAAGGVIDADGSFVLSTFAEGDGAVAGEHRVVVTQTIEVEPGQEAVGADGEEQPAGPVGSFVMVPESRRIPDVYADYAKSPLTATVEPGPNTLELKLTRE